MKRTTVIWPKYCRYGVKHYITNQSINVKKNMLTDYFSCYKLNNKSTPFQEEKISLKFKDCRSFSVIKVLGYSALVFINCKKKNIKF